MNRHKTDNLASRNMMFHMFPRQFNFANVFDMPVNNANQIAQEFPDRLNEIKVDALVRTPSYYYLSFTLAVIREKEDTMATEGG